MQALFLITIFPDANHIVQRIEEHVLEAKEDEALILRKSASEDCTMLAVAAAIVAQVAITALALDKIDQVHWTAKAAFVVSLSTGGLSVFYACLVQQKMSSLFTVEDVKDFFSQPSSSEQLRKLEKELNMLAYQLNKARENERGSEMTTGIYQKLMTIESLVKQFKRDNRWKAASFHSILMVKAPTLLLKYALAAFVIGLGIYYGCLAFNKAEDPGQSPLAIFLFYLISVFLGLLIYYVPAMLKGLETSSLRRYAYLLKDRKRRDTKREEEMLENITRVINSDQPQTHEDDASEDALSWEERFGDVTRPELSPSHTTEIRPSIHRINSGRRSINSTA
ncbi:uncharacterized protein TRUGW13939_08969 [Talaromyces rugulosus]|uniref:Uncharacterized protein n=1 Tax=Talaromyces rugulosus TaxID=121627 RepID=A0A7H8RBB6_TALRU|nr:uncharacterized protein TRUGW13939_08969 [Talaromyces rugulosus]QKX61813.1 hypothetical protein TRUGW13939_08969 [Talaromyces rugulosus]